MYRGVPTIVPVRGEPGIGLELLSQRPGESEVEQLDAVRSEEDVRGLEVAVDDPAPWSAASAARIPSVTWSASASGSGSRVSRSASASP